MAAVPHLPPEMPGGIRPERRAATRPATPAAMSPWARASGFSRPFRPDWCRLALPPGGSALGPPGRPLPPATATLYPSNQDIPPLPSHSTTFLLLVGIGHLTR